MCIFHGQLTLTLFLYKKSAITPFIVVALEIAFKERISILNANSFKLIKKLLYKTLKQINYKLDISSIILRLLF